jgi:hypothetical protein
MPRETAVKNAGNGESFLAGPGRAAPAFATAPMAQAIPLLRYAARGTARNSSALAIAQAVR